MIILAGRQIGNRADPEAAPLEVADPDARAVAQSAPASVGQTGISAEEFSAAYERSGPTILRYATRCVGRREIAEELTSEAFLALHRNRESVRRDQLVPWLFRVVKNLAVDYWRRATVERRHSESLIAARPATSIHPALERLLLDRASLKPEHRVCLILRYVHGMKRKEIARYTGMTENQVKSCLQYGLELLRKALAVK